MLADGNRTDLPLDLNGNRKSRGFFCSGKPHTAVRRADRERHRAALGVGNDELPGLERALQEQKSLNRRGRKRTLQSQPAQKRCSGRLNAVASAEYRNNGGGTLPISSVDQTDQIDVCRKPAVDGAFCELRDFGGARRFILYVDAQDVLRSRFREEHLDRGA